jgi:hypothetical protein
LRLSDETRLKLSVSQPSGFAFVSHPYHRPDATDRVALFRRDRPQDG